MWPFFRGGALCKGGEHRWRVIAGLSLLLVAPACKDDKAAKAPVKAEPAAAPAEPTRDWEAEYRELKTKVQALTPPSKGPKLRELDARLRAIVEHAQDPHLRANACILAASMYDAMADYPAAISYYRQAISLVPQEPAGYALMALAYAAMKNYDQAILAQQEFVRRDPDDLQAWLVLGELNVKAKRPEDATKAYAAYETRRKGLLDGLTKKKQGAYLLSPALRVECVHALALAPDAGTSLALLVALQSDPEASVRGAILDVIQEQRYAGYLRALKEWKAKEPDPSLVSKIDGAIQAIEADPVQTRPSADEIAKPSVVHPSKR